jgi:hypothetical protein
MPADDHIEQMDVIEFEISDKIQKQLNEYARKQIYPIDKDAYDAQYNIK